MNKSKIFGIGLPRTGTTTLNNALRILGYRSLHNPHSFRKNQLDGCYCFDGEWDALTNFGEHIYPQLDECYPGSRFILTVRDKKKWIESIENKTSELSYSEFGNKIRISIFGCHKFNKSRYSYIYDLHIREAKEYFRNRPEDLLIVDWEKGQGWKELCSFLNKSVPNVSFPHDNRGNNTELSRAKWLFYRMYYFINERYKNYV
jgi:hypothetical protein